MAEADTPRSEEAHLPCVGGFHGLVEMAPSMLWVMDARTLAMDYRNAASWAFVDSGARSEGAQAWRQRIHPEDLDRYLEEVGTARREGREYRIEFRYRRADGEYRWVLEHAVPNRDATGEIVCFVGSTVDITERVEAEEAVRASQLAELNRLRSLLPVCAGCSQIRSVDGVWMSVAEYATVHLAADVTHGLCPACLERYESAD